MSLLRRSSALLLAAQMVASAPASNRQVVVTCLEPRPSGSIVAAGCSDGSVRSFDAATGESACIVHVDASAVRRVTWNPAGDRVAVATVVVSQSMPEDPNWSYTESTVTWSVVDPVRGAGRRLLAVQGGQAVNPGAAWRHDGRALLTWGCGGRAFLAETEGSKDPVAIAPLDSAEITAAAWSADGKTIVAGDSRGALHVFDAVSGLRRASVATDMSAIRVVHASPDGRALTAGGDGIPVGRWTLPYLHQVWQAPPTEDGLAFDATGSNASDAEERELLAAADNAWTVQRWSPGVGRPRWLYETMQDRHQAGVHVTSSPDGRFVAVTDVRRNSLRLRDAATGAVLARIDDPDVVAGTSGSAWTADGRCFVVRTTGVPVFDGRSFERRHTWYPEGWVVCD